MLLVPVGISPRVDYVFKALLGDPNNTRLLIDFLNAVLNPRHVIVHVTIENPFSIADVIDDKLTVVDIVAKDKEGRIFQIEMQSYNETALKKRIVYSSAQFFTQQLSVGKDYDLLKPVIAIWVLDENILRDKQIHHCFTLMDESSQLQLNDSLEIHTIELEKWRQNQQGVPHEMVRWLRFLTEAEHWSAVPEELKDPVMEEAMGQLEHMQQNTQFNHAYRVRLDGMRRQRTQELALERAEAKERAAIEALERIEVEKQRIEVEKQRIEADKERAEADKERAEADKERAEAATKQALIEKAKAEEATKRMQERLRAAGIDSD